MNAARTLAEHPAANCPLYAEAHASQVQSTSSAILLWGDALEVEPDQIRDAQCRLRALALANDETRRTR